ncbi:MAG: methionyl-tRNA formyltransferase [Candidatus Omnitrophota bacterium]
MNIVFFGSSQFAIPSLMALLASKHSLRCVVTQPDRRKGRHLLCAPTVVKTAAVARNIKTFQPEKINSESSVNFLKDLLADLFVVVSYGNLLSEELLAIPKYAAINIHASLLPAYRGAAPINWAIMRGEKVTGLTIFKLAKEMDAGPILAQQEIAIDAQDDASTLENRLAGSCAPFLLSAIDSIESGNAIFSPQDAGKITLAPKLRKADGLIEWEKSCEQIHNLVRGCIPWPAAFTHYKGKHLKLYKTHALPSAVSRAKALPGEIVAVSRAGIEVACGCGTIMILELQLEGKRRMAVEEFIIGHKVTVGEAFYKK